MHFYKKAASFGHARALFNLGILHLEGEGGLDKDIQKATQCFLQAAKAGLAPAQRELALIYAQHHSGEMETAVEWFEKGAKQKVK